MRSPLMSMAGGGVHVRVMRVVLTAVPDGERGAAVGTVSMDIYINIIHFLSKLQAYSVHRYLYACCHTLAVHSITKLGTMAKCVAIANEIMNVDLL